MLVRYSAGGDRLPALNVISYSTLRERRMSRGAAVGMAASALICSLVATAIPMWSALGLQNVPRGTPIRPMGLAMLVFLCQGAAVVTVAPLAGASLYAGSRWRLVWVFALLALLTLPAPWFGTRWLCDRIIAGR